MALCALNSYMYFKRCARAAWAARQPGRSRMCAAGVPEALGALGAAKHVKCREFLHVSFYNVMTLYIVGLMHVISKLNLSDIDTAYHWQGVGLVTLPACAGVVAKRQQP